MALDTVPGVIAGRNRSYESTNFQVGSSPVTISVFNDLGKFPSDGYIVCDGAGSILVQISDNGTNFGDSFTMLNDEILELKYLTIHTIKITHSGSDSAYRILVI